MPRPLSATDAPNSNALSFGQFLRSKRVEKRISLRKFADLVGVSATYLSQIEQCNVVPPTADRIERIAELLGEDADEWTIRAGRVPDDLCQIISEQSTQIPKLLRAVRGMTSNQLRQLLTATERIKSGD